MASGYPEDATGQHRLARQEGPGPGRDRRSPELEDVGEAAASLDQAKAQVGLAVAKIKTAEADRETAVARAPRPKATSRLVAARRWLARSNTSGIKDLATRTRSSRKLVNEHQLDLQDAAPAACTRRAAIVQTARAKKNTAVATVRTGEGRSVPRAEPSVRVAESRIDRARVLAGLHPDQGPLRRRRHAAEPSTRAPSSARPPTAPRLPLLTVARTDLMRVRRPGPRRRRPAASTSATRSTVVVDALKGRSFARSRRPPGEVRGSDNPHDARRDRPAQSRRARFARGCTAAR